VLKPGRDSVLNHISVSVIVPTFSGSARIGQCLDALLKQNGGRIPEILVVNDGSSDSIAQVVERYAGVRLINQVNAGPASARNRGAEEAHGSIILFTDDDCVPTPDWVDAMIEPFKDPEIVGTKGVYRTKQRRVVARFVQIEYEDRYRLMSGFPYIDFVDTYSAGFRRNRFLEMNGYDTSFPLACAEDVELSYRMSVRGWKMKFASDAVVYHTHPDTLWRYCKKKYKFAFWRMLAVRKNPSKGIKDTHTPQLMKLQVLFIPVLVMAVAFDLWLSHAPFFSGLVLAAFVISSFPFAYRAFVKDPLVGLLSPVFLIARSFAQLLGVTAGLLHARRKPSTVTSNSAA
jgi:cellulose synthase/poly-beta-1,6-N-acetylglucosamine synthase-like glycosyltransferase